MKDLITEGLSERQKALLARHGTPAGFAIACYELVPGTISMDEAKAAIEKYQAEWDAASDEPEKLDGRLEWKNGVRPKVGSDPHNALRSAGTKGKA